MHANLPHILFPKCDTCVFGVLLRHLFLLSASEVPAARQDALGDKTLAEIGRVHTKTLIAICWRASWASTLSQSRVSQGKSISSSLHNVLLAEKDVVMMLLFSPWPGVESPHLPSSVKPAVISRCQRGTLGRPTFSASCVFLYCTRLVVLLHVSVMLISCAHSSVLNHRLREAETQGTCLKLARQVLQGGCCQRRSHQEPSRKAYHTLCVSFFAFQGRV